MKRLATLLILSLFALSCTPARSAPATQPAASAHAQTSAGAVIGLLKGPVRTYLAIPYAATTAGPHRFSAPTPPQPWTQPRDARQPGPICPQPISAFYGDLGPQSEDCLHLNVWTTAAPDAKKPVLFWIHGGAFAVGANRQSTYDGTLLANDGLVVVGVDYRVGPLGFLAHPALSAESRTRTSGNYGLLDIILALQWVRDNIAQFGGDPDNVTIFGQSAGGAAVTALMTSPLAKGLFHRAAASSPNHIVPLRKLKRSTDGLDSMEAWGQQFVARLNIPPNTDVPAFLRSLKPEDLLKAQKSSSQAAGASTTDAIAIDNYVLNESIASAFAAGRAANVPFLVGTVADEGTWFAKRLNITTAAQYADFLKDRFGPAADRAAAIYPAAADADVHAALVNVNADIFHRTARTAATAMKAIQPNTYLYHFTRTTEAMKQSGFGVRHGDDGAYWFGTLKGGAAKDPVDIELSRRMRQRLARFAATGSPNIPGQPDWPAFDPATGVHLRFNVTDSTAKPFFKDRLDALDAAFPIKSAK